MDFLDGSSLVQQVFNALFMVLIERRGFLANEWLQRVLPQIVSDHLVRINRNVVALTDSTRIRCLHLHIPVEVMIELQGLHKTQVGAPIWFLLFFFYYCVD